MRHLFPTLPIHASCYANTQLLPPPWSELSRPLQVHAALQTLAVVGVKEFASVGGLTGGRACPAYATTLSPLGRPSARASASACAASGSGSGSAGAGAGALADADLSGAAAAPAFHSHDLIVQGAELHAGRCPRIEVILNGDSTARAAALADRDILVKGRGALDRWLVDLLVFPYRISGAVARDGAFLRALRRVSN